MRGMPTELTPEEEWYKMLTEGEPIPRRLYHLHGLLPSDPRCKMCGSRLRLVQARSRSATRHILPQASTLETRITGNLN